MQGQPTPVEPIKRVFSNRDALKVGESDGGMTNLRASFLDLCFFARKKRRLLKSLL
jgi:hypothetical protein